MTADLWFKFFSAQYLVDRNVHNLPYEMRDVLVRCWCLHSMDGFVANDAGEIARRGCMDILHVQTFLQMHMQTFFVLQDAKWQSRRMQAEKERSERVSKARREAALKSHEHRGNVDSKRVPAIACANTPANAGANCTLQKPCSTEVEVEVDIKRERETPARVVVTPIYDPADTSDDLVEQISHTIPKNKRPELTKQQIVMAAEKLCGTGRTRMDALTYLLERAERWAAIFTTWPKNEQRYALEAHNWLHSGTYAVSEDLWRKDPDEQGNPTRMPQLGAGTVRELANVSAADRIIQRELAKAGGNCGGAR